MDKIEEVSGECEKVNIGSEHNLKWVNLEKFCKESEKYRLLKLLKEFEDVFTWSYKYLKDLCRGKFKHEIPLKPNAMSFSQKIKNYNPRVASTIFREVDKMLKECIIYPVHHSTWVANIVLVRKKSSEIRICIDLGI